VNSGTVQLNALQGLFVKILLMSQKAAMVNLGDFAHKHAKVRSAAATSSPLRPPLREIENDNKLLPEQAGHQPSSRLCDAILSAGSLNRRPSVAAMLIALVIRYNLNVT
jgi:hypothetical protein